VTLHLTLTQNGNASEGGEGKKREKEQSACGEQNYLQKEEKKYALF